MMGFNYPLNHILTNYSLQSIIDKIIQKWWHNLNLNVHKDCKQRESWYCFFLSSGQTQSSTLVKLNFRKASE